MRKAIKFCLALAMAGTMAAQAYAADVTTSITGHAEGTFHIKSSKAATEDAKNISYQDMDADGELGAKGVAKGDVWTATGFIELDSTESAVTPRDIWAMIEDDTMSIKFGRQYATGVQQGGDYIGPADYMNWVGENLLGREALVNVGLKGVGLNILYGMNETAGDEDGSADTDDTQYNITYMGAIYFGSFGDIDVSASYISAASTVNKDNGGVEKGAFDGGSASEIALAGKYNMGNMHFSLNYSTLSEKAGYEGAESMGTTYMDLIFDMDMEGPLSGISFAYSTVAADKYVGADKEKNNTTKMSLGTIMPLGAAKLYLGYASKSEKGSWEGAKTGTGSDMAVRLKYAF